MNTITDPARGYYSILQYVPDLERCRSGALMAGICQSSISSTKVTQWHRGRRFPSCIW